MESNGNMDQANIEKSGIESSGSSYSLSKEATDFSEEAKLALVSEGNNQRATKILEKIKRRRNKIFCSVSSTFKYLVLL